MKKILLIGILSVVFGLGAQAQYSKALGIRGGSFGSGGITFKTSLSGSAYLELIGNFDKYRTAITGVYEKNYPLGADGLKWYWGLGASAIFWDDDAYYKNKFRDGISVAGRGALGLDFVIPGVPINLSLDWMPFILLDDGLDLEGNALGLGIRYTF